MYFTDGTLLEYEQMMRQKPEGYHLAEVSSNTLARPGADAVLARPQEEVKQDECGQ